MNTPVTRKRFLLISTGLIGGVFLTACGQAATQAPPATQAPAQAANQAAAPTTTPQPASQAAAATAAPSPVILTAQGKGKVNLLWQMSATDAWMKASTTALSTLTDKVTTIGKITVQPTPDDWINKLVASMVAGTAPDVFDMWGDIMPPFVERNQVVDVGPLAAADYKQADLEDFYPWQWRDFVMPWLNNIRFGMPRYVNIMFLWYRKDQFDKAGVKYPTVDWTHVDYADAARKLTVKDSSGNITTSGLGYPVWGWDRYWYKPVIWGGHTVDPNDNKKAVFASEPSLAAFEWSRKLMWDDGAMVRPLDVQKQSFLNIFPTGRLAMAEDGIYPFEMDDKIQGKFPWAYAHTPKGPTGQRKVLGTTDGTSMWKGGKNQDQAWELMKWVSGPENQMAIVTSSGRVPVRFSVLKQWKDLNIKARPNLKDVNLDVAVEAMNQGYPSGREFFKDNNAAQEILIPALEKIFITGGTPVSYLKDIESKVTDAETKGSR